MLDNGDSVFREVRHHPPGGIGIQNVSERHLQPVESFGVHDASCGQGRGVQRRLLVGVLSIPQVLNSIESQRELVPGGLGLLAAEVSGDGGVVKSDMLEGLASQLLALLQCDLNAIRQALANPLVVRRIDDHQNVLEVLGGAADHGRATYVDVLQRVVERHIGFADRLHEWVEIDGDDVDGSGLVIGKLGHVALVVSTGQNSSVDCGMECLDPPFQNFRRASQVRDLLNVQTSILEV